MSEIGFTSDGGLRRTIAFLSLPLYLAKSSLVFALRNTTSPVILPLVPGVHAAEAPIRGLPALGSTIFMEKVPRSHATGISHGSSFTLVRPYSFILASAHLLAFSKFAEPVMRGPMTSHKCWRLAFSSALSLTSAMIFRSISTAGAIFATSPSARGVGAFSIFTALSA